MQIYAEKETGIVYVTANAVASFARQKNADPSRLGFVPVADDDGDAVVHTDVEAAVPAAAGEFSCQVTCVADAVFFVGGTLVAEKQKTVRRALSRVRPADDPALLAEAMLNAYLVASASAAEDVAVRLRFIHEKSGECAVYESRFSRAVLQRIFAEMFARAVPFIEVEAARQTVGRRALAALRFPYSSVREGQRD
ncbi:MAG: hypothetical protein J6S41_03420, partial [Clostridia bacterium]|nr:hypothetical protein [Clostridia bacterium]